VKFGVRIVWCRWPTNQPSLHDIPFSRNLCKTEQIETEAQEGKED